jgi:hypothetical protein
LCFYPLALTPLFIFEMDVELNPILGSRGSKATLDVAETLQQRVTRVVRSSSLLGGSLDKCVSGDKIVHYQTKGRGLNTFWPVFSLSHSILSKRGTWLHMGVYAFIVVVSLLAVHISGAGKSVQPLDVPGEIRTILSFVVAGTIYTLL